MSFIDMILQRRVVIVLAIIGALIASYGSYQKARGQHINLSQRLVLIGYAITGLSVIVFIAAGFRSAWI